MNRKADSAILAQDIQHRLKQIVFSNIHDVMSWGPEGVRVKPSCELDEASTAAIAEVREVTNAHGRTVHIRLHDKLKAVSLLMQIVDLGDADKEVELTPQEQISQTIANLSTEQLEAAKEALDDPKMAALWPLLLPMLHGAQAECDVDEIPDESKKAPPASREQVVATN